MEFKVCTKCGCEKPMGDFRVRRFGLDGLPRLQSQCKPCENARNIRSAWSEERLQRKRQTDRDRLKRADVKDKIRDYERSAKRKEYQRRYAAENLKGGKYCLFMVRKCDSCNKVESLKCLPIGRRKKLCDTCFNQSKWQIPLKPSVCPDCGVVHIGKHTVKRCDACNRVLNKQNRSHISRAKKYGVAWENINSRIVYAKDKYRCYLCSIKVVVSAKYRPDQATLDCVVPMSSGGPFMYYNVKTCCHRCNSAKSDSIYNEHIIKHAKGAIQFRLAI